MKILLVTFLSFFIHSISFANSVCSEAKNICVKIEVDQPFNSKDEGRFLVKFTGVEVEVLKIDLWMQMGGHGHGHGHGSSPLKVTRISPFEYDVTKAYFVMKGNWQIRVKYKLNDSEETLIIPVEIKL